jgi:outer membrane lipoprotein SlyB
VTFSEGIMDNKNTRIHPLMAAAAVSVILVSATGIAAITGLLPSSYSNNGSQERAMQLAAGPATSTPSVVTGPGAATSSPASSAGAATATVSPAALVDSNRTTIQTMPAQIAPVEDVAPPKVEEPVPAPKPKAHVAQKPKAASQPAPRSYASQSTQVAQAPICVSCGRIEAVQPVQQAAKPSGLGVAAGAVLGGVLGNQVGNGNGRTLATIAGAVGGGYAGNEVEKRTKTTTTYQVRVRMEDGTVRTFPYQHQPAWSIGDRVRVVDGQLASRA